MSKSNEPAIAKGLIPGEVPKNKRVYIPRGATRVELHGRIFVRTDRKTQAGVPIFEEEHD